MVAAVRSVGCTAILLIGVIYVFAIIFTDAYHQGKLTEEEAVDSDGPEALFGSMGKSMRHLFIMGTILDDMTACTNTIRSSEKSLSMMSAFIVFVLVSSFTMLNMLIGILCEVVTATSDGERAAATEARIRESIGGLFKAMDEDGNGNISRKEFMTMRDDKGVRDALKDLEVEEKHFDMYADLMFAPPEDGAPQPVMNLENTINMIMRLRPGTKVSALDFASFQQEVFTNHAFIKQQINRVDRMITKVVPYDPEDDEDYMPPNSDDEGEEGDDDGKPALTMEQLAKFTSEDILYELHKRIGMQALQQVKETDPALNTERMQEAFEALCTPQQRETDREAWLKDTYTC
jgi:hypothetical protein